METKVKKYCRVVCKLLGILTVLLLTLAVFAPSSFGASDSGSCGDNLTWSYYNSTLYISGSGKMNDYSSSSSVPWRSYESSIKTISIGSGVKSIGDWAFYKLSAAEYVTIPSSVTSIGSSAFYGCKSLKSITIPEGVTKIGEKAFVGCTSVTELHYNISSEEISMIDAYVFGDIGIDESGVTVYFGANVTAIPAYMFRNISYSDNVTKVIFEGTKVKKIGDRAFDGCKKLKSAIYPGSSTQWNQINIGSNNDPLINCIIFHTSCNYGSRVTIKAATCTEGGRYRQTCTVCNKVSYGDTSPLGHTCSNWTVTEKPTCTAAGTREGFCNRCRKTVTEKVPSNGHRYNTFYTSDGSGHWFECSVCKNRKNVSNHVFSNNCDTDCNVCGYVRQITHDYDTVWKTDGTKHWHECKVCGSKNTVGSHAFDNNCDTDCNVCGYVRQITHDYGTVWKTDGEKHWYECKVCGDRKNVSNHVFDNACDTDCNVCGYVREITHDYDTAWKTDEEKHWHECKVCGDRVDEDAHTFDDETYFCSCGYRKYRFGDANGDKTVDGSDLVLLCRYMANYDYSTGTSTVDIFPGADANGDGVVDGIDLVLLSRYMANYDYGTGTSTVILGR